MDYFTASLNHRTMNQYAAHLGILLPFLVARLRMLHQSSNDWLHGPIFSEVDLVDLDKAVSLEQVLTMRSPAFTANFQEQDLRSIIIANERTIPHTRRAPAWSLTGIMLRLPPYATLVEVVCVMKHAHPDLRGLGFKNFDGNVNQVLECAPFLRIEKLDLSGSKVQGSICACSPFFKMYLRLVCFLWDFRGRARVCAACASECVKVGQVLRTER